MFILQELRSKIDTACRTAEEFTKLYYESLDKRRYVSYTYKFIVIIIFHFIRLINFLFIHNS